MWSTVSSFFPLRSFFVNLSDAYSRGYFCLGFFGGI